MWFRKPCAVCAEKDLRIADLKHRYEAEILTLKDLLSQQLALTARIVAPTYPSAVSHQANLALEGAGTEVEADVTEPEDKKEYMRAVERQAEALLIGRY